MTRHQLVIGVGNVNRSDDGAGPAVTRRLTGCRTKEVTDCADLVDLWSGEEDVVVVDAIMSGRTPGTVTRFDAVTTELPTSAFGSTHSFGLSAAVELSRILGRLPRSLEVYGIEAALLEPGNALTPDVHRAVLQVATEIEAGPD